MSVMPKDGTFSANHKLNKLVVNSIILQVVFLCIVSNIASMLTSSV